MSKKNYGSTNHVHITTEEAIRAKRKFIARDLTFIDFTNADEKQTKPIDT